MHQWVEGYVREQPWPAATSVDRGQPSLIQVHTKPLPRVQEASPSRAHSVARSYHHHLIMHLAHKCKMVPTEYRKITARPSQAGCPLNRCRRQGPSSQDEKKKKLWAPSNKSAVHTPPPTSVPQSTQPGSGKTNNPLMPPGQLALPGGFESPTLHLSQGRHSTQSLVSSKTAPDTLLGHWE